jgi:hypothetical protein
LISIGGDLDRLGQGADLKPHVDRPRRRQFDPPLPGPEAGEIDLEPVTPARQPAEAVDAVGIGRDGGRRARAVGCRDRCARDRRTTGVGDPPLDGGRGAEAIDPLR